MRQPDLHIICVSIISIPGSASRPREYYTDGQQPAALSAAVPRAQPDLRWPATAGQAAAPCRRQYALVGASDHGTTKSLYARDPDGIEFEVVWIIPAHLLTEQDVQASGGRPRPLELEREKQRFGADTRGGLGISVPLGVGL